MELERVEREWEEKGIGVALMIGLDEAGLAVFACDESVPPKQVEEVLVHALDCMHRRPPRLFSMKGGA